MEDLITMSRKAYEDQVIELYQLKDRIVKRSYEISELHTIISEQQKFIMDSEVFKSRLEQSPKDKCMDFDSFAFPFFQDSFTLKHFDKQVILDYISRKWNELHKDDKVEEAKEHESE